MEGDAFDKYGNTAESSQNRKKITQKQVAERIGLTEQEIACISQLADLLRSKK